MKTVADKPHTQLQGASDVRNVHSVLQAEAPVLEFREVAKAFATREHPDRPFAVHGVSFSIRRGEVVSIIGPSGCGKSTLLNMGSGLYRPTIGGVLVDGDLVTKPVRKIAFMLQKDLLMPWRTIRANVELGLEIARVPAATRRQVSAGLLKRCGLADFANSYPYQLSGGMRQRAALARTLAIDPEVLLMDEPFSAVDAQTKMTLQQDLARELAQRDKTALLITHDIVEAIALSDRVLVMSARPGRIVAEIPIGLPMRDNPLQRRRLAEVGPLVARLMDLLHIGEE